MILQQTELAFGMDLSEAGLGVGALVEQNSGCLSHIVGLDVEGREALWG